jgi:hypothetical protein
MRVARGSRWRRIRVGMAPRMSLLAVALPAPRVALAREQQDLAGRAFGIANASPAIR